MSIETKPTFFTPRTRLFIASILLAALLLFLFLPRNTGPFRALPAQSSLVLECKGLLRAKTLSDKTPDPHWREVLHSALFERCFQDAEAAVQLFKHDHDLLRAFAKNPALAAFSLNPADSLHALFIVELEEGFNLEKGLKANKLTPKYFPHQFHGNDIFNVHISRTERLEVAISGRLLLFSRQATLIEDALAQLENTRNWWTARPYLSELPEAPLKLHLRPSALAEQCRSQMNATWRGLPDLFARNVEWLGLSWNGKELAAMAESNGFFNSLSAWGKKPGNEIFDILPDNTAFLARVGLRNTPEFFKQIGKARSRDFEQYVLPWAGNEAAIAITEPLSPALLGDRLLLLAVRDSAKAVSKLRAFGKERGILPGTSGVYQMFDLLGFQTSSLLQPVLGNDEAFRNPVCALVGGYAVFAPDRSSLEIFLDKYLVSQTLAANTDFLQLQQKCLEKGRASFFLNTAYLLSLLQNLFANGRDQHPLDWGGKGALLAAEVQPGFGRKATITLASQALSQPIAETDILWKALLVAPAITQPYVIEQAQGKTFVLIQDSKNNLYCLDAQNGATHWSRPFSEHILSDIRGVDFYGNGSKCYTFSTATQIFMMDEQGRDIQSFPLNLPARATNGTTVVDFDQNTKLNYFVACDNGKIYGFGHMGKPLEGWNGVLSEGVVRQTILHFQHKGKDYLAVLTENGLLSVFERDGALRFPPIHLEDIPKGSKGSAPNFGPLAVDTGSPAPHIYCASKEGQIFACDLQGNVSAQLVGKHGSVVAFGQLNGDARFEWAVLEGKDLTVGGVGKVFKTQFPEAQHLVFFTENNHIGTVDKRGRRLWLLDSKGNSLPGFPLGGNTVFEFCSLNGVNMMVAGNVNAVWAYRVRL